MSGGPVRRERRRARALGRVRASSGGMSLSHHARMRAAELGFHETEVLGCIARPETMYPGGPEHPPGRVIYRRGSCACVVDPVERSVVTVLLNTRRAWTHGVDSRPTCRPR